MREETIDADIPYNLKAARSLKKYKVNTRVKKSSSLYLGMTSLL